MESQKPHSRLEAPSNWLVEIEWVDLVIYQEILVSTLHLWDETCSLGVGFSLVTMVPGFSLAEPSTEKWPKLLFI